MNRLLLASHGTLAEGMRNTAELLMGKNENVEILCAYVDEESKDLSSMIERWMSKRKAEDQWIVITDIFGGSINNEFMMKMDGGNYWLISGMNLPLVLSLWTETENISEGQIETLIKESIGGVVFCNKVLSEYKPEEEEDF
ncbi:MAG: hypothetical protein K5894_12910 [Lachnospiraceae bacterium]|nr:hypothetical protein [Lachnospiraceae bacterium]